MRPQKNRFWGLVAWAALSGMIAALALAGYAGYSWWARAHGAAASRAAYGGPAEANGVLSAEDVERVQELVKSLMNPEGSAAASLELRRHLEQLAVRQSPLAPLTMVLTLEQLAPHFAALDGAARQQSLALLSDILSWHAQHPTSSWAGLLPPAAAILTAALDDPVDESRVAALEMLRDAWAWMPPDANTVAERKTLAMWKASLHERAVELLGARPVRVRAAAAATVALGPVETAAQQAIELRHDPAHLVRRTLLLAVSDAPQCLASEDILPFLNDPDLDVRTTAELVLSCRGAELEEIQLARRATSSSPLVRAQVPHYVLASTKVDQVVWLEHLSRDDAPEVRVEAVRALATMADDTCRSRLREMAAGDPDPVVRDLAAQSSGEPPGNDATSTAAAAEPVNLPALTSPRAN